MDIVLNFRNPLIRHVGHNQYFIVFQGVLKFIDVGVWNMFCKKLPVAKLNTITLKETRTITMQRSVDVQGCTNTMGADAQEWCF